MRPLCYVTNSIGIAKLLHVLKKAAAYLRFKAHSQLRNWIRTTPRPHSKPPRKNSTSDTRVKCENSTHRDCHWLHPWTKGLGQETCQRSCVSLIRALYFTHYSVYLQRLHQLSDLSGKRQKLEGTRIRRKRYKRHKRHKRPKRPRRTPT